MIPRPFLVPRHSATNSRTYLLLILAAPQHRPRPAPAPAPALAILTVSTSPHRAFYTANFELFH